MSMMSTDLQVDESPLTGEADAIKKDFDDPFFMSGTAVLDGEGVMLVIAVGVNSTRGQIAASLDSGMDCAPLLATPHHFVCERERE